MSQFAPRPTRQDIHPNLVRQEEKLVIPLAALIDLWTRNKRRPGLKQISAPVRDKDGQVRAVKKLRQDVPDLAFADALQVVRVL